VGVWLER